VVTSGWASYASGFNLPRLLVVNQLLYSATLP
jgi:hypothetical protein